MTDEHAAVVLILNRLHGEGLQWFRSAKDGDVGLFERRVSGNFAVLEWSGEIHTIGSKPKGSFPLKKILVIQPQKREKEAIVGLWLTWDFKAVPREFRLFLGQWAEIDKARSFVAFRFETPEAGDEHDYYHCQPCRNFGDKEAVPDAVAISEHFPTVPLNASNLVELTLCALMSAFGRKRAKDFVRKILSESSISANEILAVAYARCCK